MIELLRREFTVRVPLDHAWKELARIEDWPLWAAHIRAVIVTPPGPLGPASTGKILLTNRMRSTFRMCDFNPPRNWAWEGPFLGLTVRYDHRFDAVGTTATRLTWVVEGHGRFVRLLGPMFARVYTRNVDRAVPRLICRMESSLRG